jgi:hypothetical protein
MILGIKNSEGKNPLFDVNNAILNRESIYWMVQLIEDLSKIKLVDFIFFLERRLKKLLKKFFFEILG